MHEGERCLFCGETKELAIQEIWQDGNFQLQTCCAGLLEHVAFEIEKDPEWSRALLRHLGAEDFTGHTLRRVTDEQGDGPVLDHQLCLADVSFQTACAFIARHHRHCDPPRGWRYGASIWNGHAMMGVVTVGNPVAPALNGRGIVEVNRLCVRGDLHPMLRWNCCSMLYAYGAREAERRGFSRIITYIRDDEDGTSLRAAGWVCEGRTAGRGWHSARRSRSNRNAWFAKQRWSRTLRPKTNATSRLKAVAVPENEWVLGRITGTTIHVI